VGRSFAFQRFHTVAGRGFVPGLLVPLRKQDCVRARTLRFSGRGAAHSKAALIEDVGVDQEGAFGAANQSLLSGAHAVAVSFQVGRAGEL
jgi:hypothetical protein